MAKRMSYLVPDLPEEIWQFIHSLMPLRDAARAACISHAFLSSWRHHPNLTLTAESLGRFDFTNRVNHDLKNHSGLGVKKLDLQCCDANDCNHLDSWLQMSVTPQLEELTLDVGPTYVFGEEFFSSPKLNYTFPCSILSDVCGSSIQHLYLEGCAFQPTVELGRLGSLTRLHLYHVHITGDELGCFLSCSIMLEWLKLERCHEIVCLKIPGILHCLSSLHVYACFSMKTVENKAQNLRTAYFQSFPALRSPGESLQLGELLQLKNIDMLCNDGVNYALAELPSIAPNLETLTIASMREMLNAPTAPSKFLHLKHLSLHLCEEVLSSSAYDYFSLASFVDASPSLETFILTLPQQLILQHDWISGGSSVLRPVPENQHHKLQRFEITRFCSAKCLVELTCYILGSTTSLERITLDTTKLKTLCSDPKNESKKCSSMHKSNIMEARMALLAIETYIKRKVPSRVELNVVEPCRRCHTL